MQPLQLTFPTRIFPLFPTFPSLSIVYFVATINKHLVFHSRFERCMLYQNYCQSVPQSSYLSVCLSACLPLRLSISLSLFWANNQLVSALAQHERTKRNKRAAEPSSASKFTFTFSSTRQPGHAPGKGSGPGRGKGGGAGTGHEHGTSNLARFLTETSVT